MTCGPFFLSAGAVGVNLYDRAVQAHRFDLDADQLFALQFGEQSIEHAGFRPAVHAGIDRVPVAEALRQRPPFAAVLRDEEDRVDHVKILVRNVAALDRQMRLDSRVLLGCDFHARSISRSVNTP